MNRQKVVMMCACAASLVIVGGSGCLPTVDPAKVAAPPAAPVPASPDTAVTPPAAPAEPENTEPIRPPEVSSKTVEGGAMQSKLKFQMLPRAGESDGNAVIRVEKAPEGHFLVSGGKGLQGTIKPDPAGGWLFEGTLTFPLKGYKPGEPFAGTIGNTSASEGPMTTISLPFSYPPKGTDRVEQEEAFPVSLKFDAPANTQFVVFLMPGL